MPGEVEAMPIRKNLAVNHDPYLPWLGPKEGGVCKSCGAVYRNKRWSMEDAASSLKGRVVRSVTCPGCRKVHDSFPGGIVTLSGGFLAPHKEEILHLIRNEESRARQNNPLERIITIKDEGRAVEVQTTSDRFAQRIGREIHRAYKGEVNYLWSRDDKFIRVKWHREQEAQAIKD
jgi:NMD protein affecting ribosome stability and mRNA decay